MISPKFLKVFGLVAATAFFAACGSTQVEDTSSVEDVDSEQFETGDGVDVTAVDPVEEARLAREAAELAQQQQILSIGKVAYFAFDQSTLSSEAKALLNKHAALLAESNAVVRLEGHADELGTREYNMALGERRAKAVMNYLASLGVSSSRMETISYGEEKPAVLGGGESVRSKNRRVEIVYN